MVPCTVKLLHREKERENQWGSKGLQAWLETSRLLMSVDNSTGKGTSGMEILQQSSLSELELGGKLFNSLRVRKHIQPEHLSKFSLASFFLAKLKYRPD